MPAPIDVLVPAYPGIETALERALAADGRKRWGLARRGWRRCGGTPPEARIPPDAVRTGPFRSWLADAEDAIAIASAALALIRLPREARRRSRLWSHLVARVADEGVLARLAPEGRIPDGFPERALREARRRLLACARGLPRALRQARARRTRGGPSIDRVLVERGLTVVRGGPAPAFARRVAAALALLDASWPDGGALVRARCWRVVPVAAWATVSYSSPRRPGVAYVDVRSAPAVRLAEDLVHEATHMRIHELEAQGALVAAAAREASGAEPRFYSPWRREWRPLRGLVHAACTFTVGELFFERMLGTGAAFAASRRRWLARRLLEERLSVRRVLPILRGAGRRGLLTADGRRLVEAVARAHRGLTPAARRATSALGATREGRRELARVARLAASLAKRPVRRWGAGY